MRPVMSRALFCCMLSLLQLARSTAKPDSRLCIENKCFETRGSLKVNQAFEHLTEDLKLPYLTAGKAKCFADYAITPRREMFFSRITPPPGLPAERFGMMLARGAIHPRGVVLDSEFYELPMRVNASAVRDELKALLREHGDAGWLASDKDNAKQGVVSSFLRLTLEPLSH